MRFETDPDGAGGYRWRLLDAAGVEVASSGGSFASRAEAERDAREFKASARNDVYRVWNRGERFYWQGSRSDGRPVVAGRGPLTSRFDAQRAAATVRDKAAAATGP